MLDQQRYKYLAALVIILQ